MPPFHFDIMDSAGYGFYRVWAERAYLAKLMLIPFLIKLACTVTILVMGFEGNILRQGLIMLPADIALGWGLAQFLRTLLIGERWPIHLPPDMNETVLDILLLRARGIIASTLSYSLIALSAYVLRFILFGQMFGGDVMALPDDVNPDVPPQLNISPALLPVMIIAAIGLFWGFRLMWIYIPLSVLMPVRHYLRALGGMMASVKMIALFFCTMAPVMFVTVMLSRVVVNMMGGSAEGEVSSATQFILVFVAVFSECLVALVATAAFTWAMRGFLPKRPDLLKEMPRLGE